MMRNLLCWALLGLVPCVPGVDGGRNTGRPNGECCGCCETGTCRCATCDCTCCDDGCRCDDGCQAAGAGIRQAGGCDSGCCSGR